MKPKDIASELYPLHPRERSKRISELPESIQWEVREHLHQMHKAGEAKGRGKVGHPWRRG